MRISHATTMYRPHKTRLAACLALAFGGAAVSSSAPAQSGAAPLASGSTFLVTNCNDSGGGSLRNAVSMAVSGDTVDLSGLSCSSITLTTGAIISVVKDISIVNNNASTSPTINANYNSQAILHTGTGALILKGVTVERGLKYLANAPAKGGCIYSAGSISLTGVTVRNCAAKSATKAAYGGGVYARASLSTDHAHIVHNGAYSNSGTMHGGGAFAAGTLLVKYSEFSNNRTGTGNTDSSGGGIFASAGAIVNRCTIANNYAHGTGGLDITSNGGAFSSTITSSTISGNSAGLVGGVFSSEPLTLRNSTIAFNSASSNILGAGLHVTSPASIVSTIIARNTGSIAPDDLGTSFGAAISGDHNLIMASKVAVPADTLKADPLLAPLAMNGGPTMTHSLVTGSVAVNAGSDPNHEYYDQRGFFFPRVFGSSADIGAFERDPNEFIFDSGFEILI